MTTLMAWSTTMSEGMTLRKSSLNLEWKVATTGIFWRLATCTPIRPAEKGEWAWTILKWRRMSFACKRGSICAIPVTYGCRNGTGTDR